VRVLVGGEVTARGRHLVLFCAILLYTSSCDQSGSKWVTHNLGKDEISSSRFRISFPFPQAGHATSTQHAEMGCSGRMELFSQSCMHGVLKKACPFSFAFQSRSCALCIGWSLGAPRQRSACARVHASMRDLNKDRKHPCFFRAERICCHTQASSCAGARQAGRRNRWPSSLFLSD
jgi:hypothetical protein